MESNEMEQPKAIMRKPRNFFQGGRSSVKRLQHLGFDPIGELVDIHRKILVELERQEKIRDGKLVELTSTGKTRAYNRDAHYGLFDKAIATSEKLLRYAYGRVPEVDTKLPKAATPLVVTLTNKGEVYSATPLTDEDEDVD